MNKRLRRIIVAGILFFTAIILFEFIKLDLIWLEIGLYLSAYLIVGLEIFIRAGKNIYYGKILDENLLMVIATIGAIAINAFAEAGAVMLFYQVGELFQAYAVNKSRKSIAQLMDIRPDYANVLYGIKEIRKSPEEVLVGDIILVRPGEKIPLDGEVIQGESYLDTMALTGEPVPKEVGVKSLVISGCVNQSGILLIKVLKEFKESTVNKILDLIENASSKKSVSENFISKFARFYTPVIVLLAVIIAFLPPLIFSENLMDWLYRGLTFLVVSCPCALVISIPMSFFGGLGGASKSGILIKGSNYLDSLNKMNTVVFDKTGTLTKGVFKVQKIVSKGIEKDELLYKTALIESLSNHPISKSLKEACKVKLDLDLVKNFKEIAGHGVRGEIYGEEFIIGNKKLMETQNIILSETYDFGINSRDSDEITKSVTSSNCKTNNIEGDERTNSDNEYEFIIDNKKLMETQNSFLPEPCDIGTIIYIAKNKTYCGYILISDEIKSEAMNLVKELKAVGVKNTIILSGDNSIVANYTAKVLKINQVYSELLPAEKLEKIEEIISKNKKGTVAFVGDGINDAPTLARADIGIAMGGLGQDAAIEAADVVIMNDDLKKIVTAKKIAQKTIKIAKENIVFAISVKVIVLILSAIGLASMWWAIFADVGVSIIAILNALRVLATKKFE